MRTSTRATRAAAALAIAATGCGNLLGVTGWVVGDAGDVRDASDGAATGDASSDGRARDAADAADAAGENGSGDAGDAGDATPGAPSPTPCADAGTATCRSFGLCCPASAPYCKVAITYAGDASIDLTCGAAEGTVKAGEPCVPGAGSCADGLSCSVNYAAIGSTAPRYTCTGLCTSNADCGDAGFLCGHSISADYPVKQCGLCDPVIDSCAMPVGNTAVCFAGTIGTQCGANFGNPGGPGEVCNGGVLSCAPGNQCTCQTDAGFTYDLTCNGLSAICRKWCYPYEDGQPCVGGGGTCRLQAGTNFAFCLP